ncbi:thioredoxin 2, putative [Plasmodium ovale curtisi]|uniref:Thioredoxin 2, putative n=1 Tax=Plasmodium ovale curtisi TaxID=864141 RepID=A0A1A8WXP1_PLAOA|nr:thioredoxin 2, putative [Plasmodium ovale curtisi]SBS96142.1 thioredoxin 2, putative [Plasmodium ovale curtisi]
MSTQQGDSPLTPLNKFDKYFLRMYNKASRLKQGGSNFINGVNMKNTIFILYFFAKWCHACKMQGGEMVLQKEKRGKCCKKKHEKCRVANKLKKSKKGKSSKRAQEAQKSAEFQTDAREPSDKLEKYYGKRIYVLKVDIDQNESMARKFAVKSLPTIIIMKNKAVLARKEHYVTSNDLVSLIRKHL